MSFFFVFSFRICLILSDFRIQWRQTFVHDHDKIHVQVGDARQSTTGVCLSLALAHQIVDGSTRARIRCFRPHEFFAWENCTYFPLPFDIVSSRGQSASNHKSCWPELIFPTKISDKLKCVVAIHSRFCEQLSCGISIWDCLRLISKRMLHADNTNHTMISLWLLRVLHFCHHIVFWHTWRHSKTYSNFTHTHSKCARIFPSTGFGSLSVVRYFYFRPHRTKTNCRTIFQLVCF